MVAIDYFLKIDGISGESKDVKHKGEIDVGAWSWGETATVQNVPGGGGGAGKVNIQALTFTSGISKASPQLMLACASGTHIKSAVLTARRAGKTPTEFHTITLGDVVVSSFQTGDGGGDESGPLDSITLNFTRIQVEYRETKPDGSRGPPVKFGWDVKTNKAL